MTIYDILAPESPAKGRTQWDERRSTPPEVRAMWEASLAALRTAFDMKGVDPEEEKTMALSLSWSLHLLGRVASRVTEPSAAASSS